MFLREETSLFLPVPVITLRKDALTLKFPAQRKDLKKQMLRKLRRKFPTYADAIWQNRLKEIQKTQEDLFFVKNLLTN